MTEGGEPIHQLGIQDAEGNFTALAALDYDTVNDELSLKHLQQNVELRTDGTSWNPDIPVGDESQPVPGTSHFEAVSADGLTVNGQVNQDARELLLADSEDDTGGFSTSVSFSRPEVLTTEAIIIDIGHYEKSESTGNEPLKLSLGLGAGNYNYSLEDEQLTATTRTSVDEFVLIEPTATTSSDRHSGRFIINFTRSRPSILGQGGPTDSGEGRALAKGWSGSVVPDPVEITIFSDSSDYRYAIAVWRLPNREVI